MREALVCRLADALWGHRPPPLLPALDETGNERLVLIQRAPLLRVPAPPFLPVAPAVDDAQVVELLPAAPAAGADVLERGALAGASIEGERPVADQAMPGSCPMMQLFTNPLFASR